MKLLAAICLVILTFSATSHAALETAAFEQARRLGTGKQRAFFMFSTSAGKYTIRHDGLGEVASRRIGTLFHLKLGMAGRVEQVYFYEYQGDLLLLYEVSDGRDRLAYATRLNQETRKRVWLTPIELADVGPCSVESDAAYCGLTTIDLKTGQTKD
ncbi:MAG TPA: hypothetical protein VJS17_00050 [Pyrinomonadaceae bacterium]|nr:hypothetical protein [Pyrinomonadaceae bacterium]